MSIILPEIQARLIGRRVQRLTSAKTILSARPSLSFSLLVTTMPLLVFAPFSAQFARYFGVSTQLIFLLIALGSAVTALALQLAWLQRRVNALIELNGAQSGE
jgi:hypothetical protein